jgi:hypothetical protein
MGWHYLVCGTQQKSWEGAPETPVSTGALCPVRFLYKRDASSCATLLFALLLEGVEYGSELLSFGRVWIDLV